MAQNLPVQLLPQTHSSCLHYPLLFEGHPSLVLHIQNDREFATTASGFCSYLTLQRGVCFLSLWNWTRTELLMNHFLKQGKKVVSLEKSAPSLICMLWLSHHFAQTGIPLHRLKEILTSPASHCKVQFLDFQVFLQFFCDLALTEMPLILHVVKPLNTTC